MGGLLGYRYVRLRSRHGEAGSLREALRTEVEPRLGAWNAQTWGCWQGIFGLHSRDLLVMISHPTRPVRPLRELTDLLATQADVLEQRAFLPTVRPADSAPLTRKGFYVHRTFDVDAGNVDRVAALSREAWENFEHSDRYASRPEGLFREPADVQSGQMLLITWYETMDAWQASRDFHPAALANFRKRAALTTGTLAIATQLLP
ncbi:MAG: hypothetical protein H6993_17780 [Pseudomonadales bacterium]|nr:hypothetical protein [Pseudomonadales bacterium]MCP5185819.1 hypothetical protein [Pseudomonadales bacterium]